MRSPAIHTVIDLRDDAPTSELSAVTDPLRVEAVIRTGLLATQGDDVLDRIARLASAVVQAPLSFVTLVSGEQQVMPGSVRRDETADAPRASALSVSFCPFVVATGEPLVIADRRRSALVRGSEVGREEGIEAYAGIPLRSAAGHVLGTLCVLDHTARLWSQDQLALLVDLAGLASHELDLRIGATRARQERALTHRLLERATAVGDVVPSLVQRAEQADDVHLQRYAALTRARTQTLADSVRDLQHSFADAAVPSQGRGARHHDRADVRPAVTRAVASGRAATGFGLLVASVPDVAVPVACDIVEVERSIVHLLVTVLSHSEEDTAIALRLTAPTGTESPTAVLTVDAPGARVSTGELSRVVARFSAATCHTADSGRAQVQVSRGVVRVRSSGVEAHSSATGTRLVATWALPPA